MHAHTALWVHSVVKHAMWRPCPYTLTNMHQWTKACMHIQHYESSAAWYAQHSFLKVWLRSPSSWWPKQQPCTCTHTCLRICINGQKHACTYSTTSPAQHDMRSTLFSRCDFGPLDLDYQNNNYFSIKWTTWLPKQQLLFYALMDKSVHAHTALWVQHSMICAALFSLGVSSNEWTNRSTNSEGPSCKVDKCWRHVIEQYLHP